MIRPSSIRSAPSIVPSLLPPRGVGFGGGCGGVPPFLRHARPIGVGPPAERDEGGDGGSSSRRGGAGGWSSSAAAAASTRKTAVLVPRRSTTSVRSETFRRSLPLGAASPNRTASAPSAPPPRWNGSAGTTATNTNNGSRRRHFRPQSTGRRSYSTTPQRDILPLVALTLAALTVRYSYRALRRMDDEWDEYTDALRDYRDANGIDVDFDDGSYEQGDTTVRRTSRGVPLFKGGALGVDLGTVSLRVAHCPPAAVGLGGKVDPPRVMVDRDGGRCTPNAVRFDDDGGGGGEAVAVVGRLAAKVSPGGSSSGGGGGTAVLNPYEMLRSGDDGGGEALRDRAVEAVVRSAARNALEQSLGGTNGGGGGKDGTGPLFALDATVAGGYNARPVFAYPPPISTDGSDDGYKSRYEKAVSSLSSPPGIAAFVPEPIAAVLGAASVGILSPTRTGPVMVIDVGGTVTSVSLVGGPTTASSSSGGGPGSSGGTGTGLEVTAAVRLDGLGGETIVDAMSDHVARSFFGRPATEVNDDVALGRIREAAAEAVVELGTRAGAGGGGGAGGDGGGRVQINVPFLTVDAQMRPRHLDMGVGGTVLEHEVADIVAARLSTKYLVEQRGSLSESLGEPRDLTSLVSSLAVRVLEVSSSDPFGLEAVLLVGGGARSPIFRSAVRDGLRTVGGATLAEDKLVVPEGELVEELVVLGAAVAGREA